MTALLSTLRTASDGLSLRAPFGFWEVLIDTSAMQINKQFQKYVKYVHAEIWEKHFR